MKIIYIENREKFNSQSLQDYIISLGNTKDEYHDFKFELTNSIELELQDQGFEVETMDNYFHQAFPIVIQFNNWRNWLWEFTDDKPKNCNWGLPMKKEIIISCWDTDFSLEEYLTDEEIYDLITDGERNEEGDLISTPKYNLKITIERE